MLLEEANKLSRQLKIDITQIVREEWEMKILKILTDLPLSQKIYFKGGTALRLAYNSPRFSEDLDFNTIKNITEKEFQNFAQKVTKIYPQVKINDFKAKFYTFFIKFTISEIFLKRNFSIKIEVSKRKAPKYRFSLRLLSSSTINLQILIQTEEIEDIYKEKMKAIATRRLPRDLFDLWFISQKLKEPMPQKLTKIPGGEIRQELNKFLPLSFQQITKELEEKYGFKKNK